MAREWSKVRSDALTIGRHFLHLRAFDDTTDAELTRVARTWISTLSDPTPSDTDQSID